MPRLSALLRRPDRTRSGPPSLRPAAVPAPRTPPLAPVPGAARAGHRIRRGAEALTLLEVAPPARGLDPASFLFGVAVGAAVVGRRLPRESR